MHFSGFARALALGAAIGAPLAAAADTYDITVDRVTVDAGGFTRAGIGYNGATPGPTLRWREGEDVTINVTNNLSESTSIHWHGIILPFQQDGVPGISFGGIAPGETFTYRFKIQQAGTYWFHSHTGFQEPDGAYGAIAIEAAEREPFRYDRDYVVQLTDAHPHSGDRIMRNLKMSSDYYNRAQRTLFDMLGDVADEGLGAALADRGMWGDMRMMPTDIEDLQGFTPLINGKSADQNWTGIFTPGERIRLRLINSSAMTYFDMRIPGLQMTVVAADGNLVAPVTVDELRIGVAETYDVIVRPRSAEAFSILAESMGRTAMGRATLAPEAGMANPLPDLREMDLLTMADMGMSHDMAGMDHGAMDMTGGHKMPDGTMMGAAMPGMDHGAMAGGHEMPDGTMMGGNMPGMDHGAMAAADPFYAPGSGLAPTAANGGKFLSYADLKARAPMYPDRAATREIELRLTGNMERYIWSINDVKYEDAAPIVLHYGERVRFKFVNETMMTHPMHLHGMWSILDTGSGALDPVKHTVSVAPGTTLYMETEVDAPGQWAFHCHLSYHADSGMFRKVIVEGGPKQGASLGAVKGG
jgi:L-ascorbate oxidase